MDVLWKHLFLLTKLMGIKAQVLSEGRFLSFEQCFIKESTTKPWRPAVSSSCSSTGCLQITLRMISKNLWVKYFWWNLQSNRVFHYTTCGTFSWSHILSPVQEGEHLSIESHQMPHKNYAHNQLQDFCSQLLQTINRNQAEDSWKKHLEDWAEASPV